jgi:TonB-dependent Receptor Plug Domain
VAQGAQVQTASSESSTLITAQQLDTIGQKGRTITNYLLLLPGFNTNLGTLDAASSFITVPNANGLSNLMTAISIDGFQGADTTSPQLFVTNINPDAIGEMTIMTNNYQAEFGRNGWGVRQYYHLEWNAGFPWHRLLLQAP